jgi:hypothetical protein
MRTLLLLAPLALASAGPTVAAEPPRREARLGVPDAVASRGGHPAEAVDIGALTLVSDFTVFMRPDCPEPLRRHALRKLWTLLPQAADAGPTTF